MGRHVPESCQGVEHAGRPPYMARNISSATSFCNANEFFLRLQPLRSDAQMYIGHSPSKGEETIQRPAPGRPLFFWVKLRVGGRRRPARSGKNWSKSKTHLQHKRVHRKWGHRDPKLLAPKTLKAASPCKATWPRLHRLRLSSTCTGVFFSSPFSRASCTSLVHHVILQSPLHCCQATPAISRRHEGRPFFHRAAVPPQSSDGCMEQRRYISFLRPRSNAH